MLRPVQIFEHRSQSRQKSPRRSALVFFLQKQFTVTVGTIFEDSHIPLRKWLIAWYLLCSSKKGISSLQLQRNLELGSYRTALFMTHRIRFALKDPSFSDKLSGTVEVDETYVGGKQQGVGVDAT